jgi:O-antigen ligase
LLLQHRTVWVVTLLGLLWLFRGQTRLLRRFVIAGAALTALGGILLATAFRDDFVMESLQDSATNPDTFIWRVGGWYQLIFLRNANLFHFLLGDPFGTGFSRVIGGFRVDVNPHNFYVGIYLRFGILGLLVLIWLYFSLLRQSENLKLNHKLKNTYLDPRLWRLFLLFHLMYFMTYYPGYEQCILLGMIVGLNAVRKSVAVEARQMTVASTLLPGLS